MGKCINHPERETSYMCMKHQVYLCEECLKCRDPKIYCKFRSSCPIWFMEKRQKNWDSEDKAAEPDGHHTVTFLPDGQKARVAAGTTLLEAAQAADVFVNASCNGKGSCGKCKLVIESGSADSEPTSLLTEKEQGKGYVLACQSRVTGDVTVAVPQEAVERKLQVAGMGEAVSAKMEGLVAHIDPMLQEIPLSLAPPTLDDSVSDLDRLHRGLKQSGCDVERLNVGLNVLRQLAAAVREEDWTVTVSVIQRKCANEILDIRPGNGENRSLGIAVDVGTTSIVVYLVDMASGRVLAATSGHNRQAACGDDVINRIVCAEKDGVKKLSRMALATINNLVGEALAGADAQVREVKNVVISGNTTMAHLLLGIEPRYIRREPYIPTVSDFPVLKAGEIGIRANPMAAVFVMPGPASYVGGDIVSGVLYAGFHREEPVTLYIDVGTNGEIVLGNRDWLMTAACSAGPAFEGGGVRWGMRAETGAIESVTVDPSTLAPAYHTVGDNAPRGICGSGMIDLISEMLLKGVIDAGGKFALPADHPRLKLVGDEKGYVVATAEETEMGEDILFTETDIHSLVLSKGAIYAGFTVLMDEVGLDFSMIERVYITGGFGQHLDIDKAVTIGLLPDMDRSRFTYLGNGSIVGAYMALLSDDIRREARELSNRMTYVDFSSNPRFMEAFTSALFLPHTDQGMFPSVAVPRS